MSDTPRLNPGDKAPAFTLADDMGNKVKLSDYRGKKVIVYFYPAAMTPGCTTQACDFTAALPDFTSAGYTVIGIRPINPTSWLSSAMRPPSNSAPVRSHKEGAQRLRRLRREAAVRQDSGRRDSVNVRHRRVWPHRAGAVRRQGEGPRCQTGARARDPATAVTA